MKEVLREIGLIARSFEAIANIEFKSIGLSKNQYIYLVRIGEEAGIILEALCDHLKVDRSTASRAVNKLVDDDMIYKIDEKNTGKRVKLFLTSKGEEAFDLLNREEMHSVDRALEGLSDEEIQVLVSNLKHIRMNVEPDWENVKKGIKRLY